MSPTPDPILHSLIFQDWGLIEYKEALARMMELVDHVGKTDQVGYLVFCTHPPIVTLGRGTKDDDVFDWKGPIESINRGGRATYHGPSQLMVYPIANLNRPRNGRKAQEVVGFLRTLEEGIVEVLAQYGVQATGKTFQSKEDGVAEEETGVWVGDRKIASLGASVRKWVLYHGAAINLDADADAFHGIKPCGFTKKTMVSLEELTRRKVNREEFAQRLKAVLLKTL